jgi:hypothetical protein
MTRDEILDLVMETAAEAWKDGATAMLNAIADAIEAGARDERILATDTKTALLELAAEIRRTREPQQEAAAEREER